MNGKGRQEPGRAGERMGFRALCGWDSDLSLLRGRGPGRQAGRIRSTTILGVRCRGGVAIGGDGQVTMNQVVMKAQARKIRRLYGGAILSGFAGAAADAFALYEKFEAKLEQYHGNLARAAVELAKDWRTDRILRRLEALLIAMDRDRSLLISGTGDVIEPDDGVLAIGSGGPIALSAARALMAHTTLGARQVVEEALRITSEICIYTNRQITVEEL
jgi:ATP-dependent HslUV protease subunit HslV